jgi:ribosomal protein L44E
MNRSDFLRTSSQLACASCVTLAFGSRADAAETPPAPSTPVDEALQRARDENNFVNNWLTDLFEAIDQEVDPTARVKLLEACGRACYRRHSFKQDIAAAGRGDPDKLVEAYRKNFGIERDGNRVHIRYGGGKCFCPAARNRPARPNDLHCECTRATHEAIFEAALGRHIQVELVETVRRGGQRCHLVANLA